VTIEGILRLPPRQGWLQPENDLTNNQWYWIDLSAISRAIGGEVAPLVLYGTVSQSDTLPFSLEDQVNISNNHLGYALTWYSLAIALVVIYVLSCKRMLTSL
jgi:surfeit locus 1 family protein